MNELFAKLIIAILETGTLDPKWLKFTTTDAYGSATSGSLLPLLNGLWGYFFLLGIGMTLIYFLIEMNQKLALEGAQNMTMKSFMSPFLKLLIAICILYNGGHITLAVLQINDAFVDAAAGGFTVAELATPTEEEGGEGEGEGEGGEGEGDDGEYHGEHADLYQELTKRYEEFGIIEGVIVLLVCLLVWIVNLILCLVWMYKALMYKLEVLFRIGITPVALADVYFGSHSNAFKWLKGFAGLGLYAGAILLLPKIATLVSLEVGMGGGGNYAHMDIWEMCKCLISLLIAPFAALGVMSTVKQMCKEALG